MKALKFKAILKDTTEDNRVFPVETIDLASELVFIADEDGSIVDFDDVHLIQYTGATDSSGTECYEYDIAEALIMGLKVTGSIEIRGGVLGIYDGNMFFHWSNLDFVRVIGNKFEAVSD